MSRPSGQITNRTLNSLLTRLGFENSEETAKFHRAWWHPEAGTVIFLPSNHIDEPPLQADLLSLRTHLNFNGLLEANVFDEFVKTGNLSVISWVLRLVSWLGADVGCILGILGIRR